MANIVLLSSSVVFFIVVILSKLHCNVPNYLFISSYILGITSILNHKNCCKNLRIIDRTYACIYLVSMITLIINKKLNYLLKYIFSGVLSITLAIYLRSHFNNNELNKEEVFSLCTILHLYSHCILILVYLYLVMYENNI